MEAVRKRGEEKVGRRPESTQYQALWRGGGWVGGWVSNRKIEEIKAVRLSYCELGVG